MKTSAFRNIIFDFGGVIINIDFHLTINAFKRLGAEHFDQLYSKAAQTGIFDELDKGTISKEAFLQGLLPYLPAGTTPGQVLDAWNAIIIDLPAYRINMLREIRKNYRTFLLSNTNAIHYEIYGEWLRHDFGAPDFQGLFDAACLSFRMGMRKPEPRIFETVFQEQGLKKEETLYIDDSQHIIEATTAMGIPSYWLQDGQEVCSLFENGFLKADI